MCCFYVGNCDFVPWECDKIRERAKSKNKVCYIAFCVGCSNSIYSLWNNTPVKPIYFGPICFRVFSTVIPWKLQSWRLTNVALNFRANSTDRYIPPVHSGHLTWYLHFWRRTASPDRPGLPEGQWAAPSLPSTEGLLAQWRSEHGELLEVWGLGVNGLVVKPTKTTKS